MTILVIGEYYSSNLGDPLLCEIVTNVIKDEYPKAKVIPFDISGRISMTEYYKMDYNSKHEIKKRRIRRYIKKVPFVRLKENNQNPNIYTINSLKDILKNNHIDLAVFAGGEMFMDYFAKRILIAVELLRKTKIIFHACGMYDMSRESQKTFQVIFNKKNVVSISLRDSYEQFIDMFGDKKVSQTFDTALLCSKYFNKVSEKKFEYGVGVICRDELLDFQIELIRYFIKNNYSWQLFTNGAQYDYDFALRLLEAVGVEKNEMSYRLHERPQTTVELVEEITNYKKIISFRMHSQIVAVSFGIPTFGFVWDNKVKEFYDKLGYSDNYSLSMSDVEDVLDLTKLKVDPQLLSKQALEQGDLSKKCLIDSINMVFSNIKKR